MKIIDGKKISEKIKDELAKNVFDQVKKGLRHPNVAVILVGQREDSKLYVSLKEKSAKEVGIDSSLYLIDENEDEKNIIETIQFLNQDENIDGILIQLPLPKKFNTNKILQTISPNKDIDGFSISKDKIFFSPVMMAIKYSLEATIENLKDKKAFLFFNSDIFKTEVQDFLKKESISLSAISSQEFNEIKKDKKRLEDLKKKIKDCKILISAVGNPGFIDGDFLAEDMIIIDIGITKLNKQVLGDIKYSDTENISGYITPVPGGIGPITVACLLENVFKAFKYGK
ncbi:MAG TPA: tetrahydrofolate dehydrogenase/cyclohydrolase catalytic domain-containing protein [bacterium]|nr:tetrahydrofolate dehydrogenase/cyclohydrolase catalytic domain-containing protein [bacterium]